MFRKIKKKHKEQDLNSIESAIINHATSVNMPKMTEEDEDVGLL